jgi:hypothetical protein
MPSLTSRCWRANKPAGSAVPLSKEEARLGVRKPGSRIAVTSAAVGVDGCRAEYLTAVKSESSYVKRLRRSPKTLHRPTALGLCSKKPGVARRSKRRFNSGANLSIYTAQRIWVPSGQCVPSTEKEFGSHLWRLVGSTQSTPNSLALALAATHALAWNTCGGTVESGSSLVQWARSTIPGPSGSFSKVIVNRAPGKFTIISSPTTWTSSSTMAPAILYYERNANRSETLFPMPCAAHGD